MSEIIGIDLGTTFSAAAQVRDGVPRILPHGEERIMPSVVGVSPQGTMLVGTPARNQYLLYPERTVRSIKRLMGQDVSGSLGERSYTPEEISAIILRELKRSAEAQLGRPVERAVITVPAYFSDAARQATRTAGELAGFTVERIVNEPTAAALAYGLDRGDAHQMVAVYDLGGGTFDVSIVELDAGVVEVRASHGNTQLGGDDFDQALVDFLAERFQREHSVDPRADRRALARLTRAAEAAKITLSSEPFAQVREEYLLTEGGRPLHLDVEVSRAEFEGLIENLLEGTLQSLDAAIIAGEPLEAILVDVTPHSLGIEVADWEFGVLVPDRYSVLIARNTTIPTVRSEVYSALTPSQTAIQLKIYQGEHHVASRNTLLGEFLFDDLRPEVAGQPPRITVQFDFDVDGIVHVSAVDRGSGKQARTTVTAARVHLSPAEIASTRAELETLPWEDEDEEAEHDEEELEEAAASAAAPSGAGLSPEMAVLLARARRVVARGAGDTPALAPAISALEA